MTDDKEQRNKKITVIVIGVIVLLIVLVGATYAYFSAISKTEEQNITTAQVDLEVKIEPEATNIKNIKPTTWNESLDTNKANKDIIQIPIKVINHSTISVKYFLRLSSNDLGLNNGTDVNNNDLNGGKTGDVKYILYSTDNEESKIKAGNFDNPSEEKTIVYKKEIEPDEATQNYMLYIYIEDTEGEQNKLQGIEFNIQINADTKMPEGEPTLSELIFDLESPITTQPNFTSASADKGLYKLQGDIATISTIDNEKDIYYYRGAVDNNYVEFGKYTKDLYNQDVSKGEMAVKVADANEPILWRIMRINEDNSITMIMEHDIGPETENTAELYHMWNSKGTSDYINSDIKKTIDKWYTETFNETKEDNLVTDTKFCNDRSESYAAVEKRIYTNSPQPTLKCINEQDEVPAKAGLITADEIIYAGGLYKIGVTNNKTYLDNNTNFWTISPRLTPRAYGWNSIQKYIGSDLTNPSDNSTSARPVITLSSNATVTFDESSQYKAGTKDNPYKVIIK